MIVPHDSLSPDALRGVVLEFVTRDGTDHTEVEPRVERVLQQLRDGIVVLTFDPDAGTTSVVPADRAQEPGPGSDDEPTFTPDPQ